MTALLVLSTAYVTPKGVAPFWEIIAATDHDRGAPRVFCWTRNEALYRIAADVEGTPQRVALDTIRNGAAGHWREVVGLSCV